MLTLCSICQQLVKIISPFFWKQSFKKLRNCSAEKNVWHFFFLRSFQLALNEHYFFTPEPRLKLLNFLTKSRSQHYTFHSPVHYGTWTRSENRSFHEIWNSKSFCIFKRKPNLFAPDLDFSSPPNPTVISNKVSKPFVKNILSLLTGSCKF